MAELGLIAAVVQVADVGYRLSVKLYTFGHALASADDTIVFISKDISLTCSILKTLRDSLEKDRETQLYSQSAIKTAETIVKECLEIFHEMDGALLKKINRIGLDGSSSRVAVVALERLKWPFLRPKIMLLWSNLGTLKSSLQLLLEVFIYARQMVERCVPFSFTCLHCSSFCFAEFLRRTEEPSVVNTQRNMIEHLLCTTAEQSRKYESLKAAMDRNENLDAARDSNSGCIPAPPSLDTATRPTELRNKSKTKKLLEAPEVDPAATTLENYCTLIQNLMTEVEAKEYNIGHAMRGRIRDDVIHAHKRETRLLSAVHGHTELKEKMREKSWRLVEMAEEKAEEGEQSQTEHRREGPPAAKPAPLEYSGCQILDPDPSHSTQESKTQKQVKDYQTPPVNDCTTPIDRVRASSRNPAIEVFLNNPSGDDPWSPLKLTAPIVEKPRAAERYGWLPFQISGASKLAFNRLLPLNPLKTQLPFLRSGTSMLVTDKSHEMQTIASSQDLAALTDSTDTKTFVSAESELGERAVDSHPLRLVEDEKDGPLVVLGDQEYGDAVGKDSGMLGVANLYPSLDELLAAWITSV